MTGLARRWLITALIVFAPALTVRAVDVVRLHVQSNVLSERSDLVVQVTVARNAANRSMRITAESANYFSSSVTPIEGDTHPVTGQVRFMSVPAGWYEITGTVFDEREKIRGVARTSVLVFPH